MILGLQRPTAAPITYRGKDIYSAQAASEYDEYRRDVQPVFQDPYRHLQPVLPGRPDLLEGDREVQARELAGSGARPDRGVARGGRPAPGRRARPLPAPVLRRPAPARHAGARPHAAPGLHHRRRAGLDARRGRAGAVPERPARLQAEVRDDDPVHHPRPLDRLLPRRRDHGDLQGRIVERGPVETGGHEPAHPTPSSPCSSRSRPDPDPRWTSRIAVDESGCGAPASGAGRPRQPSSLSPWRWDSAPPYCCCSSSAR